MKNPFQRKIITLPVALTFMLGGTVAVAQVHSSTPDDVEVAAVQDCDGSAQEASLVRTDNAPVAFAESTTFAPLPNSLRTFTTPQGDTDQVRIGFSAEASLFGGVFDNNPPVDALGVEIRLDGDPLPGPGDLAFATSSFQASATMVCQKVGAGVHTVEVYARVIDQAPDHALSGRIDDWSLDIQINN